ncbi:MAG: hypoxanthine phosphoribosyltransferase [Fimbriimonadales bacterium]
MTGEIEAIWLEQFPELEVLLTSAQIRERVAELARQIMRDYSETEPPLLVGVLKGSLVFVADLMRQITLPVSFDFVATSSYGTETQTSGQVRLLKDLDTPVVGRHVLVVEDIFDTGLTLNYLVSQLRDRQPASLRLCTLLSKPECHRVQLPIDYLGFEIPNRFVVGYGLDYQERYRNLPFIAVLKGQAGAEK